MTTSLDHLLPAPDATVRCAEHARSISVDPGGTAIAADAVVLVELPGPWPKPALAHPGLAPLVEVLNGGTRAVRVLAALPAEGAITGPEAGGSQGVVDGVAVTAYERRGPSAVERRYRTADVAGSLALARALADGDDGAAVPYLEAEFNPARPALALCTQGSHDVCCGAEGTRLAAELQARNDAVLAAAGGAEEVIVHRVSHTGGHRFAPTGMTFPDGRMWAGLDTALVDRILAGLRTPGAAHTGGPAPTPDDPGAAELAASCRGWWGAPGGWGQVAERAVFARLGWALDTADRHVEVTLGGRGTATCVVHLHSPGPDQPTRRWRVDLAEGRGVPTIACRAPGGLPAKPAREYEVLAVTPLD